MKKWKPLRNRLSSVHHELLLPPDQEVPVEALEDLPVDNVPVVVLDVVDKVLLHLGDGLADLALVRSHRRERLLLVGANAVEQGERQLILVVVISSCAIDGA